MDSSVQLLYIADPMCSWCWGFAPVVQHLADIFADTNPLHLVLGGLRPGPAAERVDKAMKISLRHHWDAVQRRTGQPFDFGFFDRTGYLYDTEPPSRAVVAMRRLHPEHEHTFFHAVQKAFYEQNVDVTDDANLCALAEPWVAEKARFAEVFNDPATLAATRNDYAEARAMGVSGFPSLVLRRGNLAMRLASGYVTQKQAEQLIREGLERMAD